MKNLPPPPPPDPVDSWLEGPIDNQRIHAALEGLPAGFKKELARYVDEDHQTLVASIVAWVLVNWPDWDSQLAETCPNWLISMTPTTKPFGQMQFTDDGRRTVQEWMREAGGWRADLLSGSGQFFDQARVQDVARFLLYQYIGPRKLGVTADAFIALHLRDRDLSDTTLNRLRETLNWAHLELFGEERRDHSIPNWFDKALTIGWTFFGAAAWALVTGILVYLYPSPRNVEVLLAVIALTSVATAVTTRIAVRDLPKDLRMQRLKYPAGLVEDLAARWPDGRPRLLADPRRYFDFLADYQSVFTMTAEDLLQWAIRRSWSSVINPNFRNAFISHSHAQADVAHRLV